MKILHLLPSIDPRHGGVAEYARQIAAQHREMSIESVFVTLDAATDQHVINFPFEVATCDAKDTFYPNVPAIPEAVERLGKSCDACIIHGLFGATSIGAYHTLKKLRLPWFIFTHGMLDPYFRKTKPVKHWIKQAYWTLWLGRMLSEAEAVLFTCEEERHLARNAFIGHQNYNGQAIAFCAGDLRLDAAGMAAGKEAWYAHLPELEGRDYLLYLSRIHPKKAIDNLIRAYAAKIGADGPVLVIAGPDQIGWKADLQTLASELGVADRVLWPGMVSGPMKSAAFAEAMAFTLPSHQENFGIVVAEALSVGTTVLISNKVNIWREISDTGAGLVCLDTVEDTTRMMGEFMVRTPEQRDGMRAVARSCYETHFSVEAAGAALRDIVQQTKIRRR